ncbi:MAG: hypothetical protein K9L30_10935 [Desulfobacterales bacterium]|nr:hypothetical protein [Desulfobacterales bacterium]
MYLNARRIYREANRTELILPAIGDVTRREYIIKVLEQVKWKVSGINHTAENLGLERITLRSRRYKLNIQKP